MNREWLNMDETLSFRKEVKERVEEKKQDWSDGVFTRETVEASAIKNAESVGYVMACYDIIEALTEKEDEAESEGVSGSY